MTGEIFLAIRQLYMMFCIHTFLCLLVVFLCRSME